MKYRGFTGYSQLIEGKDAKSIETEIIDFIVSLKERNYSLASQKAYLSALTRFYSINDVTLRREKISKFMSNDYVVIITYDDNSSGGDRGITNLTHMSKLQNF
jgi:hypothetical protein